MTIAENTTAPVVINLSNITPGPGQPTELVTVTASSNNPGLIANPSVSYNNFNSQGMPNTTGTLSFIPVANASGTATITVTVTNNGPTGGANVNSFSQAFTVTVTPVNQPPTLNQIGSPITLLENAGEAKAGTVTINSSGSLTIPVASGGSGYTSAPTVTLTGGTFTTAATRHGGARQRRDRRHGRRDHRQRRDGLHRGPDRHDRPAAADDQPERYHRRARRHGAEPDASPPPATTRA